MPEACIQAWTPITWLWMSLLNPMNWVQSLQLCRMLFHNQDYDCLEIEFCCCKQNDKHDIQALTNKLQDIKEDLCCPICLCTVPAKIAQLAYHECSVKSQDWAHHTILHHCALVNATVKALYPLAMN
ncbi:hypothetical protein L227DRAFT_565753 [Lentinus tigrinus ALCF2SS1-6]|uniref:Uncharacterized protein n=1 Tax=Lentinus tigrinus ALCF2SS1-6 TaxID=1328759 RepID=A0A5C2S058_9APHY|nr:hypothetical protein L227DRAFT_565753 [Lentinus tigrinus ALCF2SS1-6]